MPPRPPSASDLGHPSWCTCALHAPPQGRRNTHLSAAAPYSGQPAQGPANVPPTVYGADQPILLADPPEFRTGYHDRTFIGSAAPTWFGGQTLDVARGEIELHDSGTSFLGSSILAIASTRFAPVCTALGIRCAPSIALPRQVDGGARGLARVVRGEVEAQLCPRAGLLPSPCFPSTLWGAIAIDLALMGFAVLQHVYGPPDARGVRRIYTRRWPTWAVYYQSWRRTYVALTTEKPIDILNDGKFTLIGKTDIPHLQGAIRALMMPTLDGVQVIQARAQWTDRFSDPKLWGTMPPDVAARSPEGLAFADAMRTVRGPGGFGIGPHGSTVEWTGLDSKASTCFADALGSDNSYISAILTGVDTTADAGVYKPLVFWGILRSTVGDDLAAINRGINQGHVYPYTRFNYAEGIAEDEARGTWVDPVLSTPLPDPEADARFKAAADRQAAFYAAVTAEREAGGVVDQDRVALLADRFGATPLILTDPKPKAGEIYEYHITNKLVAPDEVRDRLGFPPLPDDIGSTEQLAKERAEGRDKAGGTRDRGDAGRSHQRGEGAGQDDPSKANGVQEGAANV